MLRKRVFSVSLFLCLALLAAGCGGKQPFEPVGTQTIILQADPRINGGLMLPVDIIYVSYLRELRDLTALGPDAWFNSNRRSNWLAKESLGIKGGERKVVKLNPVLLARSPFLVVFAAFRGVEDPSAQQVIIDYQGRTTEGIVVHSNSLEPLNAALKDIY